MSAYRKDEYNWRYDSDELPEDIIRASSALENLQLDRKARNLTSSWRLVLMRFSCFSLTKHWVLDFVSMSFVSFD